MVDPYYDGVRVDANRTNEASGRSWHIPDPEREPTKPAMFLSIVGVMVVALALVGVWL